VTRACTDAQTAGEIKFDLKDGTVIKFGLHFIA